MLVAPTRQIVTVRMSPDIAKYPWGTKSPPAEHHFLRLTDFFLRTETKGFFNRGGIHITSNQPLRFIASFTEI